MKLTLHGYFRSSATWRVRIGLHLKGLSFATRPVHLLKDGGEQHGEAHRARNPMEQVPVLEIEEGGNVRRFTQSLAILQLLEALRPEPALLPADPYLRARAWELAEVVNAGIQPLQNLSLLQKLKGAGLDDRAHAAESIARGLGALETMAAASAGRFAVGDEPTIADLCIVPQLYNARRFGLATGDFPTLSRIETACSALPAFERAHPDRQPDAQD